MKKDWSDFDVVVIDETDRYVRVRSPVDVVNVSDMIYFCEELLARGYKFVAGHEGGIICEKVAQ